MAVTREQVIAYRVAAHGLHRTADSVGELDVLDIGVQEAMGHPAGLAFTARVASGADVALGPHEDLGLAWSIRGAPHVHRHRELNTLAAALWPLSEADAAARLGESGPAVKKVGIPALEQYAIAVREMRAVVTSATAKGAASTEVSKRIPEGMLRDCRPCQARHISDPAMRVASLAAGLEIEPGSSPPILVRRKGSTVPKRADLTGLGRLVRAYLSLLGPATATDVAGYLGARRGDIVEHWPDDLAEVAVEGRTAWLPPDRVDALTTSPEPDLVRLLGPFDPYLQARDRDLIVPDKAVQKALWPTLGRPGVVLVDGEVGAMWRTKSSARKLTITVETFGAMSKASWTRIDTEAERVAQVRGAADVVVKRAA